MTVLVGLPRDERARAALHLGALLGRSLGEPLVVCTVVPPPWPPGMGKVDAEYQEYLDAAAQDALDEARDAQPADVPATYVVARARSTSVGLLDTAREHGAGLLALGSSTAGVLGRVAFGSVAERLLHSSPLPVALAPRGFRARGKARIVQVTAAYGASEGSDELVVAAAGVAARVGAGLRVASFAVRPRTPRCPTRRPRWPRRSATGRTGPRHSKTSAGTRPRCSRWAPARRARWSGCSSAPGRPGSCGTPRCRCSWCRASGPVQGPAVGVPSAPRPPGAPHLPRSAGSGIRKDAPRARVHGGEHHPSPGAPMADKSPRQSASKKSEKSIKEKRAIKKGKKDGDTSGVLRGK